MGIPGNILSAIVWLRRGIASNNSSAVYLAALAVEDLAFLLFGAVYIFVCDDHWLCQCCLYILTFASDLESLLVLGFSVERLIAILHPLQVRRMFFVHPSVRQSVAVGSVYMAKSYTIVFLSGNFLFASSDTFDVVYRRDVRPRGLASVSRPNSIGLGLGLGLEYLVSASS